MPGYSPIAKGADVQELLRRVDVVLSTRLASADFDTRLSATRAARIDNLDALISSRLASADFDARLSATRAARIDRIVTLEEHSVGTLTADGTEQTVTELTVLGTLEGHIDLSNMASGDTVRIREYIRMKTGGAYQLYDSVDYSGALAQPALHMVKLPARYGVRITLQQTAGVNRDYDYNFFREVLA
jgi:hypothetical protein